jgi:hypothetical protein
MNMQKVKKYLKAQGFKQETDAEVEGYDFTRHPDGTQQGFHDDRIETLSFIRGDKLGEFDICYRIRHFDEQERCYHEVDEGRTVAMTLASVKKMVREIDKEKKTAPARPNYPSGWQAKKLPGSKVVMVITCNGVPMASVTPTPSLPYKPEAFAQAIATGLQRSHPVDLNTPI